MASVSNQQPVARTVGRRIAPPPGVPPGRAARAALAAMARYRTRAPKGVFRYSCHEQMIRDRERWAVEAIVAAARARG
jgi:hypothetical protein